MTAFSDLRQNPFDLVFSDRVMDAEIHTVSEFTFLPGLYGIVLQDLPTPGTIVLEENVSGGITYQEVTTTPAVNQYRVNYTRGIILFNPANNTDIVLANYSGRGTSFTVERINELISVLGSTFTNIWAAITGGLTFKSEDGTDVALFGAGNTSDAEFFGDVSIDGVLTSLDSILIVIDSKTANTSGGTATSGALRTRDLNTVLVNRITSASLSSNQITLPAGTYEIEASAPAFGVRMHKAVLYNITDAQVTVVGSSEYAIDSGNSGSSPSNIKGEFTIASPKIFEIQHRVSVTVATFGFGYPSNFSLDEIYTSVKIKRKA